MFTLVYFNGKLNKPETLSPFLHSNVGKNAMLRVDCVTPYKGTEQELIKEVCEHLNRVDLQIEVTYQMTQNVSAEVTKTKQVVHFIVLQIRVVCRNSE